MRRIYIIAGMFIAVSAVLSAYAKRMKASDYFEPGLQRSLADAAAAGRIEEIDKLITDGAKIDFQGREGMTALIWAILHQNKSGYEHLLERGANPNLQMTASTLTSDGVTAGNSAVGLAAMHEDPWYLKITLEHGGDPNLFNTVAGVTPIFRCIALLDDPRRSHLEHLQLLIAAGANLNARNALTTTPLMYAAMLSRYDMVYILLKAGADPTLTNRAGVGLAGVINNDHTDPGSELYAWRGKVIEFLERRGIHVRIGAPMKPNDG